LSVRVHQCLDGGLGLGVIVLEDLSLSFMLQNGHRSRSAHDVGLGQFRTLLAALSLLRFGQKYGHFLKGGSRSRPILRPSFVGTRRRILRYVSSHDPGDEDAWISGNPNNKNAFA